MGKTTSQLSDMGGGKDNFTGPTLMTVTSEIGRVAGSGGDSAMMCVTSSLR